MLILFQSQMITHLIKAKFSVQLLLQGFCDRVLKGTMILNFARRIAVVLTAPSQHISNVAIFVRFLLIQGFLFFHGISTSENC